MLPRWGWFALVAVFVSFGMRALAKWSFARGGEALRAARTAAGLAPESARRARAHRAEKPEGDAREEDPLEQDDGPNPEA